MSEIESERKKQQANADLDAFLSLVQEELTEFKRRLNEARLIGSRRRARPKKVRIAFDLTRLEEEIAEIKAYIVSDKATETASLLETHPAGPNGTKAQALDRLIAEVKRQTDIKRRRQKDALALVTDQRTYTAILDFYILYAVFIEYFNSMKMLYQVLLAEYESNDLLSKSEIGSLRAAAVTRITVLLCRQGWLGRNSATNRRAFRESMLKTMRRKLAQRAALEVGGKKVHQPMSALCLSGGGIRSATFGLGVLQALARHGLLNKFDYLSTVSGGGYIGGWLSAWAAREPHGIDTVQNLLSHKLKQRIEPPEVTHLRSFSNYMSPRTGLLSADTWTLIGLYIRNLMLNWLVAVPFIAAFLLLPRLLLEFVYNGQALVGTGPTLLAGLVTIISALLGCLAVFGVTVFRPSLSKFLSPKSWFQQRFQRDDVGSLKNMDVTVLLLCVVPMLLYGVGITSYEYWVGQSPERLIWVQNFRDFVGVYRYVALALLVGIFVILGVVNLFYSGRRMEGGWDKFFGSIVIAISIVVGFIQLVLPQELKLFNFVVFTNAIFVVGFISARGFIWLQRKRKEKGDGFAYDVPIEFSISYLSASMGGALLYVAHEWLNSLQPTPQVYATVAVPLFVGVFMAAGTLFTGIGSKILDDLDREWTSRYGAYLLVSTLGWLAICGIVLVGPLLMEWLSEAASEWFVSVGGLTGVIAGAVTLVCGYYANSSPQDDRKPKGKVNTVMQIAPQIAAPIFAAFLLILIVIGTTKLIEFVGGEITFMKYEFPPATWPSAHGMLVIVIWIVVFLAVGSLMGWWINVNKFSLHATYRDRLIRTFLGASRGTERLATANSFIGLDEHDNIEMFRLRRRPFHVVNMTLNVAGGSALRWQTRKAESFTVTRLHCGSSNMGGGSGNYRDSHLFGADKLGRAITLGTAAAISGAAASPNMGYYTQSAAVSALMALFNVRLGWWLGNPGRRGAHTFYKNAPEFSPQLFFYEALGRTVDTNSYVYLSDGGHFENLGLYEMVLRRCRLIVVSDAGADEGFGFSDLGSAIHKIRVDMGIPIDFEDGELPVEKRSCSVAVIRYSCVDSSRPADDGILIYIKPTLNGCEPVDIVNYSKKHNRFPHESTADQWFSEVQFESYRKLGSHMVDAILGDNYGGNACHEICPSLTGLLEHARSHVKEFRENGKKSASLVL